MAEERQEKKKSGIVKRIFKWIGLGLLTLLIILGLIFQAPWKVMTLLLVILLACTILPRPARKWFWLSVGVVVIALIIRVFLPDGDSGEWRPYTFDEELAAIEAARAIPDEENAAIIYNELLKNYNGYRFVYPDLGDKSIKDLTVDEYSELVKQAQPEDTFYPDFWDPKLHHSIMSEPWSSEDHPELAQWLQQKQSIIGALMQACEKDGCRFPINLDPADHERMNRNSAMRRWAQLLIFTANNDLGEDRIDQGLEKYIAVLQMAKHQYQQTTMIDMLVGIALEALVFGQFNRFVVTGDATEEHLSVIEEALTEIKHDWSSDLPRILECEKLMMKNLFGMFYEINKEGKVRFSRDLTGPMRASLPEEMPPLTYWQRKLFKIATIWCWFYMPSMPQKAAEVIDSSYERLYAMAEPDYDWQKEPEEFKEFSLTSAKFNFRFLTEMLVSIIGPTYHRIHDLYPRVTMDKRGCQIIIALRRCKNKNRSWPESLDGIKSRAPTEIFVDPINGNSFVYKLTEENFTLYSKGKNNIDEGGECESTWDPNTRTQEVEKDDRLIWPRRSGSCETEEKNADAE